MPHLMKKIQAVILTHRLALARAALFSLVTLGTAWQVSTNEKDIARFSFWEWVSTSVGIFVLWGSQMLSFLDRTLARTGEGKSPLATGQTEFFSKPQQEDKE